MHRQAKKSQANLVLLFTVTSHLTEVHRKQDCFSESVQFFSFQSLMISFCFAFQSMLMTFLRIFGVYIYLHFMRGIMGMGPYQNSIYFLFLLMVNTIKILSYFEYIRLSALIHCLGPVLGFIRSVFFTQVNTCLIFSCLF